MRPVATNCAILTRPMADVCRLRRSVVKHAEPADAFQPAIKRIMRGKRSWRPLACEYRCCIFRTDLASST